MLCCGDHVNYRLTSSSDDAIFDKTNMLSIGLTAATTVPADLLFAAVADRTRLRILHLLTGGELCVCDLVDVLRLPQPKVSRHLATLKSSGLVDVRVDQNWRHYSLAAPASELHQKILECIGCCCALVPELQSDADRLSRKGACCQPTGAEPTPVTLNARSRGRHAAPEAAEAAEPRKE